MIITDIIIFELKLQLLAKVYKISIMLGFIKKPLFL